LDGIMWKIYWVPIEGSIYLHYAIDITELKELESMKLEDEKLKMTIKTIGAITHDLSQPLMVAMGNLDIFKADNDFKDNKHLKSFNDGLEKISVIVHQLQNVVQIRTKKYLNGEILDIDNSSNIKKGENDRRKT